MIPIADQQVRAQPVEQPGRKRRITPPSANTILVAPIVLMAIATWLVAAGVHDRDKVGARKPGTYHEAEQNPQWTLDNSGVLFGAIDVALLIIVIGGFLAAPSATASSPRLVILLPRLAVGIFVVLAHADRVNWDPTRSLVHDMKEDSKARVRAQGEGGVQGPTARHKTILAVFGLAFGVTSA